MQCQLYTSKSLFWMQVPSHLSLSPFLSLYIPLSIFLSLSSSLSSSLYTSLSSSLSSSLLAHIRFPYINVTSDSNQTRNIWPYTITYAPNETHTTIHTPSEPHTIRHTHSVPCTLYAVQCTVYSVYRTHNHISQANTNPHTHTVQYITRCTAYTHSE